MSKEKIIGEVLIVITCIIIFALILLASSYGYLKEEIEKIKGGVKEENKIPSPYYNLLRPKKLKKLPEENKFISKFIDFIETQALETELEGLEWITPNKPDTLNCSKQSAYLEWYLEKGGFHTKIVWGKSPFPIENSIKEEYAWVLVEISNNSWIPIKSTVPCVVSSKDENYQNYFNYTREFENIYEACEYCYNDFDWWNQR